jgi:hypothetical protein
MTLKYLSDICVRCCKYIWNILEKVSHCVCLTLCIYPLDSIIKGVFFQLALDIRISDVVS